MQVNADPNCGLLVEHVTQGAARFLGARGDNFELELFVSPWKREMCFADQADVRRLRLCEQTRVYVERDRVWQAGRVVAVDPGHGRGYEYTVQFPNGVRGVFPEAAVHVRCAHGRDDPTTALAVGAMETQFWHDHRLRFGASLAKQRAACRGLRGIISSSVELVPHQVDVARRILEDPVQRYLLADEVGMGKTIEAGFVVRQFLLTGATGEVWIVAPPALLPQWRGELSDKFHTGAFAARIRLFAPDEVPAGAPALLIVDEAHHLVSGDLPAWLEALAQDAARVLLLSATPSLRDAAVLLRLLRLIDPVSYADVELAAFEDRLARQEEIGIFIRGLRTDASAALLRQRARRVAELFPDDGEASALGARIAESLASDDRTALAAAVSGLRSHVADLYRLHHRLVRSRRRDVPEWFLSRGPEPGENGEAACPHVRRLAVVDPALERALAALDEWRVELASRYPPGSPSREAAQEAYARLFEATWCGAAALARAIEETTEPWLSAAWRAHFADILADTSGASSRAHQIAAHVKDDVRERVRADRSRMPKLVVFGSDDADLDACTEALRAALGRHAVLDARRAPAGEDVAARFRDDRAAAVLLCGRSHEEGVNLHFADAIVHLDLPASAQRIEQRIGRLDRFGRRHDAVEQRIVLPALPVERSPWAAWCDVCAQGFRVFNEPIADVQFVLADAGALAFDALFESGPGGLRRAIPELRERLDAERRTLEGQHALDRVLQEEDEGRDFFTFLEDADGDEDEIGEAVQGWLVRCLGFHASREARDLVEFGWSGGTLLPTYPWQIPFKRALDVAHTVKRRRAVALAAPPRPDLLRIGGTLLTPAERHYAWDDRGTAFATWRVTARAVATSLAFKICYFIEARIPSGLTATEEAGMRARLDGLFPPSYHVLYLDADLRPVDDPEVLQALQQPYRSAENGGADYNIGSRLHALYAHIDAMRFEELCRHIREHSERRLRENPSFVTAVARAVDRGTAHVGSRLRRLRRQLATVNGDADAIVREVHVLERAAEALRDPQVTLDSIGAIVLSPHAPPAECHD